MKAAVPGPRGAAGTVPARPVVHGDRLPRPWRAAPALVWLAAGLSGPVSAQLPTAPGASAPPHPHVPMPALRAAHTPADKAGRASVWVDLELPELATLPRDQPAERAALRLRIQAQQDAVMGRLRALGATEQARVQQVRNALAVRLPVAQLDAARRIPGVRAVRIVRNLDRGPLVQGK
jgi:hypothetical protein